ncbi:ABC transporter substrate-binding protein [Nocardioides sp.]|uniref:ABC transporter substrate-binding protein n=1 Tax=Nocardioides sp. TaxID=35761 RepID=UPI0039E4C29F
MKALTHGRGRAARLGITALAAATLLAACGSGSDSDDEDATGAFEVNTEDCLDPDAATATIDGPIKVGFSVPLSGPVAGATELMSDGLDARIALANDAGGVDGQQIEITYKDDAFQPDRSKSNGTEFIEKDGMDVVSVFGSGGVAAMADDQNAACVPMLYASASDPQFFDLEAYPWTVQFLPSARSDAKALLTYVKENVDEPKIGVVANSTAAGTVVADAFKDVAEDDGFEIVAEVEDTDPAAAAAAMKEAGVNVVFHAGVAGACTAFDTASERVQFDPELSMKSASCTGAAEYITAGKAADGVVVSSYLKQIANPEVTDDPDVVEYLEATEGAADQASSLTQAGWLIADLLVNTLTQAAESEDGLSRLSIIEAARDQDYDLPLAIDGIHWVSSSTRPGGVNGHMPMAWNAEKQQFEQIGEVIMVD